MRRPLLLSAALLAANLAAAQEAFVYSGFAELRQPQNLPQNTFVWQPGERLFSSLVPGTLRLLGVTEQSRQLYQAEAANPLAAYLNKPLQFYWEGQWRTATLVQLEPPLYRYEDRFLPQLPGLVTFPDVQGFKAAPGPRIQFRYQGGGAGTLAYLTRGISWNLRYSLEVAPGAQSVELTGWATLSNGLGVPVRLGRTELIAGSVPLLEGGMNVPTAQPQVRMLQQAAPAAMADAAEFVGEASGTYRYRLPGEVNLEPGQTELPFIRTQVRPVYTWRYQGGFNTARELSFNRGYRFPAPENLAAGVVSIRDQGVFVGQAQVGDTAKNNSVFLSLGPDPEGRATRQVEQPGQNRFRVTTTVRNTKPYPVEVEVLEYLPQPFSLEGEGLERLPEGYRIRFALQPAQSRSYTYSFTVQQR